MCLFCLAGPSRRFDSGCLWAGLASLRVPPPCSIVRALHQHKLGTAAWPSLQQVRRFLAEELKGLHGAFFFFLLLDGPKLDAGLVQWVVRVVRSPPPWWLLGTQPCRSTYWALSHVEVLFCRGSQQECTLPPCFPWRDHVYCKYFYAQSQAVIFPLVGGPDPTYLCGSQRLAIYPYVLIQLNFFLSVSGSPAVLFELSGFLPDIPKGCPFWQEGHIPGVAPNSPQHPGCGFQRGRYLALELWHKGQTHLH